MSLWKVCLFISLALALPAQDLGKLPAWAEEAAREVATKPLPDADAWVVLDRTEMAYTGGGEIRSRKLRLVRIITERGLKEAGYGLIGLGGKASKVNRLRGWNLRPDDELVKLDDDHVGTTGLSNSRQVTSNTATVAVLPRATKGSWIAFESQETFNSTTGPSDAIFIMRDIPIHRWELTVAKKEGWFTNLKQVAIRMDVRNFHPWIKEVDLKPGESVRAVDVPALPKDESAWPDVSEVLPWVLYRFQDPELRGVPSTQSWDQVAGWVFGTFQSKLSPRSEMGTQGMDAGKGISELHRWMSRELAYKQVYLSPERGWVPEQVAETLRKRYGDCKDLAACVISEAASLGLKAYPVLANISGHGAGPNDPPHYAFDHAIAAIRLEKSLGLPAEVETPKGRFLLMDPTSRFTPLGLLPVAHREGDLLVCTESEGIWVHVPASAVEVPRVKVVLEGRVLGQGRLETSLRYEEEGDALCIRSACLGLGPQRMREWVLNNLLDLPPTGSLEVVKLGDPLEGNKPFEAVLKIVHPDGFHLQGSEGVLVPFGLPTSPNPIQKTGVPRQFPVQFKALGQWEYEAKLMLPWAVSPALAEKRIDTPFRRAEWSAEAAPEGSGSRIHLTYRQQRRDAFFDFPEREKGVSEWKKDRSQYRGLLSDGLAFKLTR